MPSRRIQGGYGPPAFRRIQDFLSIAATGILPSRRIQDFLSIAATGILPSRRIQDFLSIAATGILPSRRIQDFLSITPGAPPRAFGRPLRRGELLKPFSFRGLFSGRRLARMTFFDGIAGLASNLIGEPVKQWQRRKTLKVERKFEIEKLDHEASLARAQATLEMARQGQAQDYDLDRIAMKNMASSWKDELVLVIFLTPVVLAFVPGMDKYVQAGFAAIERMPEWYMAIVIGMVVVIYGLRGLLKAWLQRGFSSPLLNGRPPGRGGSSP